MLSCVLRVGYFQVVRFLQLLLPFQRMMEGSELGRDKSLRKCLTYTKAIFAQEYDVLNGSVDRTPGAMLYGMLLSSELLKAFATLGWIRHPGVSSALVVASL